MIYGLYAIRDVKVGFLAPTVDVNDLSAIRNFHFAVTKSPDVLGVFKSDFALYQIGTFDTDSGIVTPLVPIKHLCEAVDAPVTDGGDRGAHV